LYYRVINIENDNNKIVIVCKGDFAGKFDRLSNPEVILGKLTMIIRGKKVITNFPKSGILSKLEKITCTFNGVMLSLLERLNLV